MLAPWEVPIDPDADAAREWVKRELEKDVYADGGSTWLRELLHRIMELLNSNPLGSNNASLPGLNIGLVVAIVVIALVLGLIVFLVLGPLRATRKRKRSAKVFDDDARDLATLRSAADDAALREDWTLAVIERFRAVVRRVEDAGWVVVQPGMTAFEFVTETATEVPAHTADLLWAAELFDAIRYGHAAGDNAAYQRLTSLDVRLGATSREALV